MLEPLAKGASNPVTVTPEAVQLTQYLAAHPASDLQVTDTTARRFWLHDPVIRNDSLIGVADRNEPTILRGVGLDEIQRLAQPHYDVARTVGLGALTFVGMATVSPAMIDDVPEVAIPMDVGGE